MKKMQLWKKMGAMLLSGILVAGVSVCFFGEATGTMLEVHAGNGSSSGPTSDPTYPSCGGDVSYSSGPSPVQQLTANVENAVTQRIEKVVAAAVEAGVSPEEAVAQTVVHLDGRSLGTNMFSVETMNVFKKANVDIEFSYDYNGYHYVILIPAGEIPIDEDIPWYGPLYLEKLFGAVKTPIEEK